MNNYDLKGEVAVITGAAQGIGFAVAQRFIKSGAIVCLLDIDSELLDLAKKALGKNAHTYVANITDFEAIKKTADDIAAEFGKISIAVNSAGVAGMTSSLEDYPLDEWNKIMNINVNGTFHVCKAVVPHMKANEYGRVINIASIAGKEGNPNASAYSASKAAVIGLTKSLGKELADMDIAVNCITPAAAKTKIFDQISQEFIDFMLAKIPRGRFLKVEEVASMVCWLASSENSFTTAGVFDISGGRATY